MGFVIIRRKGTFCIVPRTEKSLLYETERALFDWLRTQGEDRRIPGRPRPDLHAAREIGIL